ncbi:uncharacterized protein DUF1566 [Desulfobotulus alkaliphilus]|uniref:Uncharacterized protein DUF1566 n=1 Tax=Desulfobotulus alkaliphilus TaxID=622671 RepID=A0A562S220_9BACT|nr:DUF1566 domain-containing protein [Desulfobotulus alkaliphilus]TWI75377.1 uncharacterized protein DUF1566 [Desulfobotulus alkaliphilus]
MKISVFFYLALLSALILPLSLSAQTQCSGTANTGVLSTTPSSDFEIHANASLTHKKTGLTWMRCALGQSWEGGTCTGDASMHIWQDALMEAEQLNREGGFGGFSDWRLPNYKELASIVEERCTGPAMNALLFPGAPASVFWSSTPLNNADDRPAAYIHFNGGDSFIHEGDTGSVRLVRSSGEGPRISVFREGSGDIPSVAVGEKGSMAFTVKNLGTGSLLVSGIRISGNDAKLFTLQEQACTQPLTAGASCSVSILFAPETPGVKNATLEIESNDPGTPVRSIQMAGKPDASGLAPAGASTPQSALGCFIDTSAYGAGSFSLKGFSGGLWFLAPLLFLLFFRKIPLKSFFILCVAGILTLSAGESLAGTTHVPFTARGFLLEEPRLLDNRVYQDTTFITTQTRTDLDTPSGAPPESGAKGVGVTTLFGKNTKVVGLPLSYQIHRYFSLKADIPWYESEPPDGKKESGLGDISTTLRMQLGSSRLLSNTYLSVKLPTGDEEKSLGSGSYDISLTQKFILRLWDFRFTGMMGYTHRMEADIMGFNVDYGDRIAFMAALEYALIGNRLWVGIKGSGLAAAETKIEGKGQTDSFTTFDAGPEIRYFLPFMEGTAIQLGAMFPVATSFDGEEKEERNASFSAGFAGSF